jgi:hypothetical protein
MEAYVLTLREKDTVLLLFAPGPKKVSNKDSLPEVASRARGKKLQGPSGMDCGSDKTNDDKQELVDRCLDLSNKKNL